MMKSCLKNQLESSEGVSKQMMICLMNVLYFQKVFSKIPNLEL